VREILDVDPNPRTTPVTSLDVVFSEAIQATTFDFNDLSLTRDGSSNLITSAVNISQVNATTYRIENLSGITSNLGTYQLSVNASGIQDIEGQAGVGTVTENWLVNGDRPAITKLEGITSNRRKTPLDNVTVTFTEAINPTSFDLADILLTRNNGSNLINAAVTINQISATTYQIAGLTSLTTTDGDYQLLIQANGVTDTEGNSGIGGKGFNWLLDATAPIVTDIIDLQVDPRNTPVSSLDVVFSKPIDLTTFTNEDITLTLNGGANLITTGVTVSALNGSTYRISGLNTLTTIDGNYLLTVNGSNIQDTIGNNSTVTQTETWLLDTIAPLAPTNILVAGNTPKTQTLINTLTPTISGNLAENGLQVFFLDKTTGDNLGQATVTGQTFTKPISLTTTGSHDLELVVQDAAGNSTRTALNLFADNAQPTITEFLNFPNNSVNPIDSLDIRFSEAINLSTFDKNDLTLSRDGVNITLPDTVSIKLVAGTTYQITGLQAATTVVGNYQFKVDGTTIQDNAGNSGDAAKNATFSIVAPPSPGVTITQTNGNTNITEGSTTDTYRLVLKTQPTADVIVTIASNSQLTTNQQTLTFTSSNWNVAQEVTVTAIDDKVAQGDRTTNITHTLSSTDVNYANITIPALSLAISDNDAEIRGFLWEDVDGNGTKNGEEVNLANRTVYLDSNNNGQLDLSERFTTTNINGVYTFDDLRAGNYIVAEVLPTGWHQTYPLINVSTSASADALYVPSEALSNSGAGVSATSATLTNFQSFVADPQFANIKGQGYATVIIDTGADLDSPFFGTDANGDGVADRIIYQHDFADNDNDASDRTGHGSHVASIAAQLAPNANLIILKVFKDSGTGSFADLEKALQWVNQNAATYNIASVNLSLGDSQNWNTTNPRYGIGDEIAAISAQNVIIAAAAGNNFYRFNSTPGVAYPAADPNTIAVGAVWSGNFGGTQSFSSGAKDYSTDADRIASFSQRDANLLDVFAPGVFISGANATGGTQSLGGTSQATPFVSGIAVLAQQIAFEKLGRKLTVAEFRQLLDATSIVIKDGDDENDNVVNTGASYPRIDLLNLAKSVTNFSGGSININGGVSNTGGGGIFTPNISGTQILTHLVTLVAGQTATDKNFGSQRDLSVISGTNSPDNIYGTSGNDTIDGLAGNDYLNGGLGNDSLNGGDGNDILDGSGDSAGLDTFVGGAGDDVYGVYNSATVIVEDANGGTDTVWTAVNYALADNIENMYLVGDLVGTGNNGDNFIIGYGTGNNTIYGLDGNDTIFAGDGNDILNGGKGDDILDGENGNDLLYGEMGADSLYGANGDDYLNGGLGNDFLNGGDGNDVLDGSGDIAGLDTFAGGAGDDVYGVYNSATVIVEDANGGTDTVWTAVNYALADNIENMYLVGDLVGTGNNGDNFIIGYGTGNNTTYGLDGNDTIFAGDGNDILNGGKGDDILDGENGNDLLYGEMGADSLYGANGDDYLNGGLGNDSLNGGDGNDVLDGSGDIAGLDTFAGGAGDDVYGVYNSATVIVEDANGGTDTVWTAVNYALTDNIENMYLVGDLVGTGNNGNNFMVGYGAGNNTIYGLDGNDTIDGGLGTDNLFGGAGNDSFILNTNSPDNIGDFTDGDQLQISASSFGGGLTANVALTASQLLVGTNTINASTIDQRFIYNSTDGDLFFDIDGSGTVSAVKIATLITRPSLNSSGFTII
jgi:Ca2+-binding RTX toxin-like protein